MSESKRWQITLGQKHKILAEFEVPMYRLNGRSLREFLKALVVRARCEKYEEMVAFHINRRRGQVFRDDRTKIIPYFNFEHRWSGHFCGDWECYSRAVFEISVEEAEALKTFQEQNRRGA